MINAYAAEQAGQPLSAFQYDPGPIANNDVEIRVEYCGICHSDLSMLNNDWGISAYPFVPGHEVVGEIVAIGDQVSQLQVGDRVGLGWHAGYCNSCQSCLSGDQNLCTQAVGTIVGRHGGFADRVRAQANSVVKLPEGISLEKAGPLLCAGITVFNPLIQYRPAPTARVAVIGIGGLGHLALQFLRAWGCEVTAFTSSPDKQQQALELGAHHTLDSTDKKALFKAANSFDLILSTVNVALDWDAYIQTLKPKGRLHLLGSVLEPLSISVFPMMMGQRQISSSPVGAPAVIAEMLEFAVRHNIEPQVEVFPLDQVNEALEYLEKGSPKYRVVLRCN